MRAERIIDELAQEIAKAAGAEWRKLPEDEREKYRQQAREKAETIRQRMNDRKRKYAE